MNLSPSFFKVISKNKKIMPILLFLWIQLLFIDKYARKQQDIPVFLISLSFVLAFILIEKKLPLLKIPNKVYKISFFTLGFIFFVFSIYINQHVDGYSLNNDRWSSTHFAIKALLNGDYPYSATDHLNGRTSNLPMLIFINIPFYALGDVGYFQCFGFLVFMYLIYKYLNTYQERVKALLLILISVSYYWEIYAKSDLLSNSIFLFLGILYFNKKEHFETQTSIIKAGFITISLLFSRLFTIIPLILVLSKKFIIWDFRKKTTFSVTILAVASICLYIVLHAVPNLNTLLKNNPLELQNRQNPLLLSIIFITIPLIYSQYVKSGIGLLYSSIFFLCIPILSSFLIRLTKMGWQETIYESGTDISYFNILLPLIIFAIALNPKKASEL